MKAMPAFAIVFFFMAAAAVPCSAGARNSTGKSEVTFFVHGMKKTVSGAT